jgi:uncharacterized protein YkwD
MYHFPRLTFLTALALTCALAAIAAHPAAAHPSALPALQTEHTVREPFLSVWQQGGIELFGYPISPELSEVSRDDGQTYTVQYFERVRLELHPGSPQLVQLGRLGTELATPTPRLPADPQCLHFPETGHMLCGEMASFWASHGGLAIFGYPIGPALLQTDSTGATREIQYAERARLERDPASGAITIGLLGVERLARPAASSGPASAATLASALAPFAAPEEASLVELVNAQRAAAGLAPLIVSSELTAAAQEQSAAMAATGHISHTGLDGRGPAQRIADAGYHWLRCGENIAVGQTTPEEVVSFWMGSPPHRANILDPGMREIGAGYVGQSSGYGHYWTITLGER